MTGVRRLPDNALAFEFGCWFAFNSTLAPLIPDVSPMRISHVIKGSRPVTAELALLFGRAFDQTPQYWLNLQADYDLKTAEASMGERLRAIHAVAHA